MAPGNAKLEPTERDKADTVFHANVITLDEATPRAQSVAVADGQIIYVGDRAGAEAWIDEDTVVHDWRKATMYPGFVDAHGHVMSLGAALSRLDLSGTRSAMQVVKRV